MTETRLDREQRIAALERMLRRYEHEAEIASAALTEAGINVEALRHALADAKKDEPKTEG